MEANECRPKLLVGARQTSAGTIALNLNVPEIKGDFDEEILRYDTAIAGRLHVGDEGREPIRLNPLQDGCLR